MKYHIKTKDARMFVKARPSLREHFNESEIEKFKRSTPLGFLVISKTKRTSVEYICPTAISMKARLASPITRREFLFFLAHTISCVRAVNEMHLSMKALVLDPSFVFVNGVTSELYFLYVPLTDGGEDMTPREFVETILYSAIPADQLDRDCIQRFAYHLKSMRGLETKKVEQFIVKEDRSVWEAVKDHRAGGSGYLTNKRDEYYEHYNKSISEEDIPTGKLDESDEYSSEEDWPQTGKLEDDDEDTWRLDETECSQNDFAGYDEATGLLERSNLHFPTLTRDFTEETFTIDKPVFRIGKEKSYVDFFVTNNNAISRSHADIVTRGDKYFVVDQNSLNKTFLNNQQIPPKAEIELHDGDILRLANEEFIFHV